VLTQPGPKCSAISAGQLELDKSPNFAYEPDGESGKIIDPSIERNFDLISKLDDGDFRVMNRELDNSRWIRAVAANELATAARLGSR
jgi:hypothetical protein